MALNNAFQEIINKRTASRFAGVCAYQTMYDSLSKEDKKTLDEAWEKNYPVNLIVQALRSEGHKCSSDTIRIHRNGTCRCPKE
jgi:hypothetical protein